MKEIVLATGNSGKVKELSALLAPIRCIPQNELNIPCAEETGLSFIENALLKARHASALADKPALADDSGLVVDALRGVPGIHSARYAGNHATDQQNITKLLDAMKDTSASERYAYFYCAIVMVEHANDPTPLVATGKLQGYIASQASGTKGFGYDPIFYVPTYQCTLAELSSEIKNDISHRGKALKALLEQLLE